MSEEEQMKLVKAVLIGESGTGKTSIITRLKSNDFNQKVESTMCSSMFRKIVTIPDYGPLMIEMWDTAGQEKYRSINKLSYKDAQIVIFVYDITSKKSFDEIKSYWYEQVKENCNLDTIALAVCGNKCALFDKEAVPEEHLKLFSNRIEGVFQLTSCFTGTGINDLFNKVAVLYLQKTNGIIKPKPKPLPSPQPKPIKNNKCCK